MLPTRRDEIDEAALERLHQHNLGCGIGDRCGIDNRDDTGHLQPINPSFENTWPRW
ncbi:hypothetical protein [Gordonia tangerina]|uniref:HNH endonuclease n=1 Tax=Gordonia tangerina TaxID=2911060 RepID=A0ABS9DCS7_9ACTN|nr:hypothetical protein [Gordonia tangerina]MCF3937015.1 hypothetical protein [Gordonia tangerina]